MACMRHRVDEWLLWRTRWLLSRQSLGVAKLFVAWLVNLAYSLALVFASTWTVVALAPEVPAACLPSHCCSACAVPSPQLLACGECVLPLQSRAVT